MGAGHNGIALLRDKHNKAAEAMVRKMFGVRLWVPEDLNKWTKSELKETGKQTEEELYDERSEREHPH